MNNDDLMTVFKNNTYAENLFIELSKFNSEQEFAEFYDSHNKKDKTWLSRLNLPSSLSYQQMLSYMNIYKEKDRHYPRIGKCEYCSDFFVSQLHEGGYFSEPKNLTVFLRHFYIPEQSVNFLFKQDYFQNNILHNIKALFDEREIDTQYMSEAKIYKKSKKEYFERILKNSGSELISDTINPETTGAIFKFLSKNFYTQKTDFVKNFHYPIAASEKELDDAIAFLFTSYKNKQRDTIYIEKVFSCFSNEDVIKHTLLFLNRYTDAYSYRQINPHIVPYLFNKGIAQELYNIKNMDSVFNAAISELSNKSLISMFDKNNEQKRNDFYKMVFNSNYSSNIKFQELYKKDPDFLTNEYFQKSSMQGFIMQLEEDFLHLGLEFNLNSNIVFHSNKKIDCKTMKIFQDYLRERNIDKENAIIRNVLLGFSRLHSTVKDMQSIEADFQDLTHRMSNDFSIDIQNQSLEKHLSPTAFTREYEKTFYTWLENNIIKFNMKDIKGDSFSPQRQRI